METWATLMITPNLESPHSLGKLIEWKLGHEYAIASCDDLGNSPLAGEIN